MEYCHLKRIIVFCLAAAMFMLVVACSGKTYAPDNPPDYGLNQKTAAAFIHGPVRA